MASIMGHRALLFLSSAASPARRSHLFVSRLLSPALGAAFSSKAAVSGGGGALQGGFHGRRSIFALPSGAAGLLAVAVPKFAVGRAGVSPGVRGMATRDGGFLDSAGRTVDLPPFSGEPKKLTYPLSAAWRWFRTTYTLYRLRGTPEYAALDFRDREFLAMAESMYAETGTAIVNGDKRRLGAHLTEKMHRRLRKALPPKDDKQAKKQVRSIASKLVQARIVHIAGGGKMSFAQIIVDITTSAQPPTINRVVFDRAIHDGADGVWRISDFLEQRPA
mmetsp:Transcript_65327/g.160850  ORF Transcript_65327/g.160850 Transcript_65327/m.160850 type:complete len:276 (-) Transcript_65327:250-1077(-)